jgi:hypothetical protein
MLVCIVYIDSFLHTLRLILALYFSTILSLQLFLYKPCLTVP